MKDFFKSFFAALLALVLFTGAAGILFIAILATMGPKPPTVPQKAVLVFNLDRSIPDSDQEGTPGEVIQQALEGESTSNTPLQSLIHTLDQAAKDSHISGLFMTGNLRNEGYGTGPAALRELRAALVRFKASGKPVIAYNQAYSKSDLYLCASASTVGVHPMGGMDVSGITAEPMFFAGAFKKYGIEMQVTRVGKYKSAVEPFLLEKMSDANREQTTKYLGDIWSEWKEGVATDRKISASDIQTLADEKGMLMGQEVLDAKLADRLMSYDEALNELKKITGKKATDTDFPQIDLETYARIPGDSQKGKNRIAVIYAEGDIVDGDGEGNQVGGDRLAREIREIRMNKKVKALVMRVNSPGGSATASEVIQRELKLTQEAGIPVVVSMGYVAASGGYWISTYADKIIAQPNTITGSIGVFGTLPNIKKLANNHGITWDSVQTAKLGAFSISRPRTEAELARIQSVVDGIYEQFLNKVAEGRKLDKAKVAEIAQGRVWSGKAALELGLVDKLGGLQEAIEEAAKLAKIEKDYRVDRTGHAKDPMEKLLALFNKEGHKKLVNSGPAHELKTQFDRTLNRLQSLNDPRGVYARMPYDLDLK